ncbi:MAG TPA: YjgN family protein [Burkholderiales bacterium]|nr:YjgN family protein [Burkholderiales bacterium]
MDLISSGATAQPVQFTGKGSEYFRIWIVNLALTILTLGIYSAWAKVRRLQYFYRNTSIAGNSFDFHGAPMAILKGRLIAVILLVAYNLAGNFNVFLGLAAFALLVAVLPWLVQRSFRFRLHNSSYRGLRFRFAGTVGGSYMAFLVWPLAAYFSLFVVAPMAHREIKLYQHANSRFANVSAGFHAGYKPFYIIYLKALGMLLVGAIAMGIVMGVMGASGLFSGDGSDPKQQGKIVAIIFAAIMAFYLLLFLFLGPWFSARMQNLVWNNTTLGPHAFSSNVRARDLFVIYLTNFLAIILTLGLFKPFADIRIARYRLTHMALVAKTSLDEFLAEQEQAVSALGEETADVLDVDISF